MNSQNTYVGVAGQYRLHKAIQQTIPAPDTSVDQNTFHSTRRQSGLLPAFRTDHAIGKGAGLMELEQAILTVGVLALQGARLLERVDAQSTYQLVQSGFQVENLVLVRHDLLSLWGGPEIKTSGRGNDYDGPTPLVTP